MKLSVENGTVVCSLDNKNSAFLSVCAGVFDGFLNGKLKLFQDKPEEWAEPDAAIESNAKRVDEILYYARVFAVQVDESVQTYNRDLQSIVSEIKARKQDFKKAQELQEKWERLCKNGCGRCQNLAYDVDLPICKQTDETLEEKNVRKYVGGVLHLYNLEPFPSENCPFNINKKTRSNKCLEKQKESRQS